MVLLWWWKSTSPATTATRTSRARSSTLNMPNQYGRPHTEHADRQIEDRGCVTSHFRGWNKGEYYIHSSRLPYLYPTGIFIITISSINSLFRNTFIKYVGNLLYNVYKRYDSFLPIEESKSPPPPPPSPSPSFLHVFVIKYIHI